MKGIIVVDVPECCDKCKIGFNNECSDMFECFLNPTMKLKDLEKTKPDWCPIIETGDVAAVNYGTWFDRGSLSCRCTNCGGKNMAETRHCPHSGVKMILAVN